MRLKQFVAAAITPAVLILGLLTLAVLHYRNDVALAIEHEQMYQGNVTYNAGLVSVSFARDQGGARPLITYSQNGVLRYAEWDSYLVVDGQVYPLWDQNHGYAFDDQHKQVFSTVSGADWQVVQVISVVHGHVEVAYSFVTKTHGVSSPYSGPHQITLILAHWHNYWLNPTITGTTFQGGITALYQNQDRALDQTQQGPGGIGLQTPDVSALPNDVAVQPNWEMRLQARPAAGVQASVRFGDMFGNGSARNGSTETWANQFSTTYTLANPDANVLLPVCTESITIVPVGG